MYLLQESPKIMLFHLFHGMLVIVMVVVMVMV